MAFGATWAFLEQYFFFFFNLKFFSLLDKAKDD